MALSGFSLLLGQILLVLSAAHLLGALAARAGQPRLIGQMAAGLLLGPSLLGALWPQGFAAWLAPDKLSGLNALGQVGLTLFMFRVGLEFRLSGMQDLLPRAGRIALGGMLLPFALGLPLAVHLWNAGGFFGSVAVLPATLFFGLALSVTAFPVLARILSEARLEHSRLGRTVLLSASLGDALAWCLLAGVLALSVAQPQTALVTLLGLAVYVGAMVWGLRPLLARVLPALEPMSRLSVLLFALLSSAFVAELLGVHAVFGAFLCGLISPRDAGTQGQTEPLEALSGALLLPLYFAGALLKVRVEVLLEPALLLLLALILLLACLGKLLGGYLAARWAGEPLERAAAVGILLNARGLMELVLLSIGLETGILTPPLYSVLVLMTLVTTAMTPPLFGALRRRYPALEDGD